MRIVEENDVDEWDLLWSDHVLPLDRIAKFKPYQRHSMMPGIAALARKNLLAINLNLMCQKFPSEYDFFPRTYIIP